MSKVTCLPFDPFCQLCKIAEKEEVSITELILCYEEDNA